ncbi:MAG TPA: nucleotidyltransferase domain-containing protein [Candidatus Mediterraneibacter gallistercoris]|uniref:Nucleotidyltransferase domain-containing protein n=1 Tax=Candidatus Mediterraneibacter gallistercoris TaxID=2838671 RepID=A0A9D2P437_9FIRM|nr:nucleotidyltransferase domain-containing protein [Candidatus Mediterraneibacter gallistercoris]
MTLAKVLEKVKNLCVKYQAEEIILFGSRAKGTALERSDIDIAVSGVNDFDALEEEIEEIPTLYTVDLLNMDTCRNELILEDIRKYGHKI